MSVIEEKKALRTYIRQTERTLDPAYKAESSPLPAPSMRSTPRCC